MITALLKGIAIGFSLAVPLGPIGVLCIRRTLTEGRRSALSTMLGAASADMIYGLVASLGVTLVSTFISENVLWFRLIGGFVMIVLGVRTYRAHIPETPPRLTFNDHAGNFVSTFFLTLTNPLTLFAFAAVFAGIGTFEETSEFRTTVALIGGVFLGSLLWFASLATASYFFRSSLNRRGLDLINRIAGTLLTVFGIAAILSVTLR
jgi:threonine/homoserine/homoserine lactone efflux protein